MRGDVIYKILSFLENKSLEMTDLFLAFTESGYGASMGKIDYQYNKRQADRYFVQIEREKKRNLQKYIYKLKSDGLISENSFKKINLSKKGEKKLDLIKKTRILDKNLYKKENGKEVIIISYDIPVLFNRERNALREILKILGLKMIHQSVWVGKIKLPNNLIVALEKAGILEYVEIFKVTKSGSLKEI